LTWDFGSIGYVPVPQQWMKKFEKLNEARENWDLLRFYDNHHYGWEASLVTDLGRAAFWAPQIDMNAYFKKLLVRDYGKGADLMEEAYAFWSEAITYFTPTNEDQYGPFRVGPAYPLIYRVNVQIPTVPYAHFGGNRICFTDYAGDGVFACTGYGEIRTAQAAQRIPDEIRCLEKMENLFREGREMLESVGEELTGVRKADCLRLCNLVHYMEHCTRTTIHTKQWALLRWAIKAE
jgi:hypothetical protein